MKILTPFVVATVLAKGVVDDERQALVDKINETPGVSWRAAIHPRFQGAPVGASRHMLGVKAGAALRLRQGVQNGTIKMAPKYMGILPDSFDAATNPAWASCSKLIGNIRDQSNCGCCWAFAGAEAASDRLCIATNGTVNFPLSANDLCFCESQDGCGGGFLPDAWDYIAQAGLVTGGGQGNGPYDTIGLCSNFPLPHCHHHGPQGDDPYPAEGEAGCPSESSPQCPTKCDSQASGTHADFAKDKYSFSGDIVTYMDVNSIANAIMSYGPVEAAFTVYADFENYAGGIYSHVTGDSLGGHAVKIVGWGSEGGVAYWKIANSWNPYWGEKGYFRIKKGADECGIEDQVVSSSADSVWGGGILPPPPGPPDTCTAAMRQYCGPAKSAGASVCRGCCNAYQGELHEAGCTSAAEEQWCQSS